MSFISLPTGKLHKKKEKRKLKIFCAGYIGKFYRNLANNIGHDFLGSEFYGRISNDADISFDEVQKCILASIDFTKGMLTDINHYVTKNRINNTSFREKLDLTSKNILRRQNPIELVLKIF